EAISENPPGLADAVCPVDSLHLDGGVPPRVEQKDVIGGGQIEPEASGLQADQKNAACRIGLKTVDPFFSIAGLAVEIFVGEVALIEIAADDGQVARELRKDQRLVPLFQQIRQVQSQRIELGAGSVVVFVVEQGGMAGRLPQPQERLEHVNF